MIAETRTGLITSSDGVYNPVRADKTGALVTADGHARYAEAIRRGNCYYATSLPGASLGTALVANSTVLTLYNPPGSQVYLSLISATVALTTPPAAASVGSLVLAGFVNPLQVMLSGQTLATTFGNALLGATPNQGVGKPYTAVAFPSAPVVLRSIGGWAFVGVATSSTNSNFNDPTDGLIMLSPGVAVTIQGILSASVWNGTATMLWEEIPI